MDETVDRERSGAPLTQARIIEAALDVIDGEGLPALNMRRLGGELGVKAMAVYRHFPNKDAVLDGIVACVLQDLGDSSGEGDWREGFRGSFLALRSLLLAHPNALPLIASRPLSSPQLARRLESTRDLLLDAGLPEESVLHLLHAGMSLTLGYLWLEAGGFVGELPDDAPFLRRAATASPQGGPTLAAAATWDREHDFEAGLDLLIEHSRTRRR
jgi:TetR/AcrR family transcriptional regulator, tetracycline repressor protein